MAANLRRAAPSAQLIVETGTFGQHFGRVARFRVTMTKYATLSRPTTSAIAAFLALSAPVAFAQEAPVIPMTPPVAAPSTPASPTVQPPATTAPAAGTAATTAEPQPVIRVPLDLPAEPKAAPRDATKTARVPAERPRPRAAASASTVRAAAPVAPVAGNPAPVVEDVAPMTAPTVAPIEPAVEATPAPAETAAAPNDGFPWGLVGGAAALLIAGGAGLAFARRRRATREVWDFEEPSPNAEWVPAAEPAFAREREDAASEPAFHSAPEPQRVTTPTFAAAPSGSMGRHEAMAMAGPTHDNPFATLSKRLARARFLDRQERAVYEATLATAEPRAAQAPVRKPVSAWEISQRQTAPAPAEQEVRRLKPATVRTDLKPGWTRS